MKPRTRISPNAAIADDGGQLAARPRQLVLADDDPGEDERGDRREQEEDAQDRLDAPRPSTRRSAPAQSSVMFAFSLPVVYQGRKTPMARSTAPPRPTSSPQRRSPYRIAGLTLYGRVLAAHRRRQHDVVRRPPRRRLGWRWRQPARHPVQEQRPDEGRGVAPGRPRSARSRRTPAGAGTSSPPRPGGHVLSAAASSTGSCRTRPTIIAATMNNSSATFRGVSTESESTRHERQIGDLVAP